MMRVIAIFSFVFILAACKDNTPPPPPDNALSERQFMEVMVDVHLVEAVVNQKFVKATDSTRIRDRYYAHLFDKHNITRTEFDSTFSYYLRHPGLMNKIYTQVHDSLKALSVDLEENEEKYQRMEKDTAHTISGDTTAQESDTSQREIRKRK